MQGILQHTYSFDDFTLDLERGCLIGSDQREIRLRPKSFTTLKYLVENNGRLISKNELIGAVWPDTAVTDNSLVQCLKEVREALRDNSQRYVKTIPRRGYIFTRLNGTTAGAPLHQTIAVLPFKSLGADEDDKYLGLGIADTLITRLGSTKELIVRPTSSIQKYATSDHDSIAAGKEQKVDAVLEGSIHKVGDKVRVTVRLLNVKDGSMLWAYKSDEEFADVFTIEDSVSEKLAKALALNMSSEGRQNLVKHYTGNQQAYQLYAKGVFLRNQMTREGLEKSIECFQRAIELDPNYALPYAGEASSNSPLAYLGFLTIRQAEARNRSLVAKALQLDDRLPEAHAALGEFKMFVEWDWDGAESAFKRALELNPNELLSRLLYCDLLLFKGDNKGAVAMAESAFEMDPLSARSAKALAHTYYFARRYDEALEQSNKTLDLFPNYPLISLGPIYEAKRMCDEAIEGYVQSEQNRGLPAANITALRQAYAARGWRGYWQQRLELLTIEAKHKLVPALRFAELYARLDDKDKAFEWLEKAYNDHAMSLAFVKVDPVWDSFQSDPRFISLLQRMRLN